LIQTGSDRQYKNNGMTKLRQNATCQNLLKGEISKHILVAPIAPTWKVQNGKPQDGGPWTSKVPPQQHDTVHRCHKLSMTPCLFDDHLAGLFIYQGRRRG
jgi:hypothetical protein